MNKATIALIIVVGISLAGCATQLVYEKQLIYRNELWYLGLSEEPYTGRVIQFYDNGQKRADFWMQDGKQDGSEMRWWETGQLRVNGNFSNGELEGKTTFYFENGQKNFEIVYRNGVPEGKYFFWYENGQKLAEGEYSNGKRIYLREWDENGNRTYGNRMLAK